MKTENNDRMTDEHDERDDLAKAIGGFIDNQKSRIADLERQLAERNDRIAELKQDRKIIAQDCERCRELSILHAEQRDRLAKALEKAEIGLCNCNPFPSYDMTTLHVVRAALAAVKS